MNINSCYVASVISIIITAILILRIFIIVYTAIFNKNNKREGVPKISNQPLYTVLVPMFMESPKDISLVRKNLSKLNYQNLEIIYLIEEIDKLSVLFFEKSKLQKYEKYLKVPRIAPFTKPKACNYGLQIAKGEYIVIYDVEDIPHQLQIQKAVEIFQNQNLHCIQFRLNFIHDGTILSAWQRIDYLFWYQILITFLQKANAPLPLGGTSNHFKTSTLRAVGGWNSFNVTEDAELGIRLHQKGYTIKYIQEFFTQERTAQNANNLINQRVRWCKGHLLTASSFTISNFNFKSIKTLLWIWFTLGCNPIMYLLGILMLFYSPSSSEVFAFFHLINITLFFVNPFIYFIIFKECRERKMILPTLLIPFYSIFYIIPTIKAIWESFTQPHTWYKTLR